jgi:cbb3-type cytochrome oxidase maturation protein
MNALLALVPVSLVLLGAAVWALVWASRSGQFEDLDAAAVDALTDDAQAIPGVAGGPLPGATGDDGRDHAD